MTELITNIQFEYYQWLTAIPVASIMLPILLWKKPLLLSSWQQSSQTGRRNTYYLPINYLLKNEAKEEIIRPNIMAFLGQYLRYLVFFTLIFTALAQPYQQGQKLPQLPTHHDIVFIVDTSITMSLMDYQYNNQRVARMTMLKNVLRHFINELDGSRIGINVFSERIYTLAPLTTDYNLLSTQLLRLESAVLTGRMSNPSQAILYTAKQYQDSEKKPAIVLLTDINRPDRKIDPRIAAKYLAQQGYKLHIIGIGAGSQQAEDEDITSLIYQPANFRLLEEIATNGKGNFFWAKDLPSLNIALQKIKQTEKRVIHIEPEFIKQPLYMWLVMSALAWISLWQVAPLLRAFR